MTNSVSSELSLGNTTVTLPLPVRDQIELEDSLIVLLHTTKQRVQSAFGGDPPGTRENIRSYDQDGNLKWVVEKTPGTGDTYVGIALEEGQLWAYAYGGMTYQLDPQTGTIIDKRLTR
jgi:outer membrane protein assembly factor BamB